MSRKTSLRAYFPSIREYAHFDVVVTVPLQPEPEKAKPAPEKKDPEAKPWIVIDGELRDFLDQHEGKDVLVIYTANRCFTCPIMMGWLETDQFAHMFGRDDLIVGQLDCTDAKSEGFKEMQRGGKYTESVPRLALHHRDGMVTFSEVDLTSRETVHETLSAILEKSVAGEFEPIPWVEKTSGIDEEMFGKATVVVRARNAGVGEGSKYVWTEVTKLETLKAPDGIDLPETFEVASYSFVDLLPIGEATLYLIRYNPDRPEFGWKLLQETDPKSGKRSNGYSHHVPVGAEPVEGPVENDSVRGSLE